LTDGERRVVELAADGLSNREVADRLGISTRTVEGRLRKGFKKLRSNDREQLSALIEAVYGLDAQRKSAATMPRLTPREREVAGLLVEALSNKEIAKRLGIGVRTAEDHVAQLRMKLGVTSRAQIVRWVHNHTAELEGLIRQ
jgi:DNA-binding CsgD family transcriptional regulator